VVEAQHARDPSHAHVAGHADGEFEYFDRFQGRAEALHEFIVDRFVIAGESFGVFEHELFTVAQQRVTVIAVDRLVDVFADRILRTRRKSPLQSNGASVDLGDEESDQFSLSYRQLALVIHRRVEHPDRFLEDR
jgi:hypothetical protein